MSPSLEMAVCIMQWAIIMIPAFAHRNVHACIGGFTLRPRALSVELYISALPFSSLIHSSPVLTLSLSLPDHHCNASSLLFPSFLPTSNPRNCNGCSHPAFVWDSSTHCHPFFRPLFTSGSWYSRSLHCFTRVSVKPKTGWHQLTQRMSWNTKCLIPLSIIESWLLSIQIQLIGEQYSGVHA